MNHFRLVVFAAVALMLPATAQQPLDPATVLQRTRERLLADLRRMPRYTCVQTITRTYYEAQNQLRRPACSALIAAHEAQKRKLPTLGGDRLRLDVALIEGKSVYSWVGASKFTDETLDELAGEGPMGSGDFGVFLSEILLKTQAVFQREQTADGRRLLEYSYDMPINMTTYRVRTSKGWARTAYSGTLLLDPEAADIVRLTVRTAELPPESSACEAISQVTYGRTPIHDSMVLVPRETRLYGINTSGRESLSQTSFANCREYASTARLVLDEGKGPDEPDVTKSLSAETPISLPAGLQFGIHVTTPIDLEKAAAGDPIEAVLRSPIRDKKKAVIAAVGVSLHGRLRKVKWWLEPSKHFQITLQLESVEINGKNVPLTAAFSRPAVLTESGWYGMGLKPNDPSAGGSFFFKEAQVRNKELDSEWVTVVPGVRKDKK